MNDKTLVERLLKFDKFICGWEPIDDVWFGDRHPDFKGAFWWRRYSPIEEAATRIEALEARLEIDPSHPYDGIDARDETIRLLERRIETLEAGNKKLCLDLLAALGQNADALEGE